VNCNGIKFFSGSSNPALAKEIARFLGADLGNITIKKFANGETYVQFLENIRGSDVFLLQTAVEPINDHLVELLMMVDAAKRASAERITAVIPSYFYARQDRKADSREPISAKLTSDLITVAGAHRVVTMDLHSDQVQGFFNIPFDNLPLRNVFVKKALEETQGDEKNNIIVSPDAGAAKRATKVSIKMNCGLAIINKVRTEHNKAHALSIIGDEVDGKNCLIFDDMIDTGGSLCVSAKMLRDKGAKKIYAFATHGILSGDAIEKIDSSELDKVFITDSIPLKKKSGKIVVLSVAKYIADTITCIHNNQSVSTLFE